MADMANEAPYDAQFIDGMIEHHHGAVAMADQALLEAERPELKHLAQTIKSAQQAEVEQMQTWRQQWFPDLAPTGGMYMDMGDMTVGNDSSVPYDQRFITAMISHHQGAVAMARDAQTRTERPELRQLADAIIRAQAAEIKLLQAWQNDWFGGA
jgi:uncharacterized protein (DUF305 family)